MKCHQFVNNNTTWLFYNPAHFLLWFRNFYTFVDFVHTSKTINPMYNYRQVLRNEFNCILPASESNDIYEKYHLQNFTRNSVG